MENIETCALSRLKVGHQCQVVRIDAKGPVRRRIYDMGLTKGVQVTVKGMAPLGDPIEVIVRGYSLSLRKSEADDIFVQVV